MEEEVKTIIDNIEIPKGLSKLNKRISNSLGFENIMKNLINTMNHKNNIQKLNNSDLSIEEDKKVKSPRFYYLIDESKFKKFNLEEFKKKLKQIDREELNKKYSKHIYKLNINYNIKQNIETIKKNKVLSNVQKIYNPKYDLIYKRIPNVIFSYPKTIKKIKSSVNILLNNQNKLNDNNNEEKRKKDYKSENNSIHKSMNYNKDLIFNSPKSKNVLSRNILPKINYHIDDSLKKISNINYLTKNNSEKNFNSLSNNQTNKTVLNKRIHYYPDYSKISKKDKLRYSNTKNQNDDLLSEASIGSYEPKYDFVMEKSPEFSFNNKYCFDNVSFRKFIIKRLWCEYNRSLNEEYQLVELPPKINNK